VYEVFKGSIELILNARLGVNVLRILRCHWVRIE
jgi:hypothetical protein